MSDVVIRPMRREDLPRVMESSGRRTRRRGEASFRGLLESGRIDPLAENEAESRLRGVLAVMEQGELGTSRRPAEGRDREAPMDAVIEDMRERGVRELFLEVRVTNDVARHLYERYGFGDRLPPRLLHRPGRGRDRDAQAA